MSSTLALKPRMSEKAYALSQLQNTYVFDVPITANTNSIAAAVTEQFKVTVENVRIVIVKGKVKKSYRKGGRPITGKRTDVKKAYIRIKQGDSITIFEAPDNNDKAAKTTTKADKPAVQSEAPKRGLRGALGRAQRQTQNRGGEK